MGVKNGQTCLYASVCFDHNNIETFITKNPREKKKNKNYKQINNYYLLTMK